MEDGEWRKILTAAIFSRHRPSSILYSRPWLFDQCNSNPTTFAGFLVHTV